MTEQTSAKISKKSVVSAFFAVVLALGMAVPVANAYAAPSDDKQAEADAALQKLNQYQDELDQASANYEAAHQEQIDAENKVQEAQQQIEQKTTEIAGYQEKLGERARDMYRSGDTSFVDVILGASSFEQFATTWNTLEMLNQDDAQLVQETKSAREDLESAKTEAEQQAQVASDKANEAKQVADAADQKASEMQSVYDGLSAEAAALVQQEQAASDSQQAAAVAQAAEQGTAGDNAGGNGNGGGSNAGTTNNGGGSSSNSGSSNSGSSSQSKPSSGSTNNNKGQSVSGNVVVDRAYAQLGKPYVWGASGPNGFDCSGLVGYCLTGSYSRFCTTGTIMGWTRVSNPQPGDICIRSGHTGIYIGGGQMIHAPHTGDVVKISAVPSNMWFVRY